MNKYDVLWIDDDAENQDAFLDSAYLEGININYFKTSKQGMEELYSKIELYDAVILDAMVYNESEDEKAALTGLFSSIKKINSLSERKKIPYFVFSGYIDQDEHASAREMLAEETIFIKSIDNQALFKAIKEAANNQEDTQIRHEHQAIFDILKSYDTEVSKTLLAILKGIRNGVNGFDDQLYFTQLRIILEGLFRNANSIGLLHDNCIIRGQVNLTDSRLFLSGIDTNHCGVKCSKTHFPKIIAENVKSILFVTGAASHTSVVDITKNMDVQEYRRTLNTPYLLYSLTYQLMDILIWFDQYSKLNADIAINKSLWQEIEFDADGNKFHSGRISRIAPNGWGTVVEDNGSKNISIYKETVIELKLEENDRIKFTIEEKAQARKIQKL